MATLKPPSIEIQEIKSLSYPFLQSLFPVDV